MPGVRAVIDRQLATSSDHEVVAMLRRATARERVRLAVAAGLANDESEAAARAGARVEELARQLGASAPEQALAETTAEDRITVDAVAAGATAVPSFVDRIKAVLAA
jgi:hypothetical protein